MERMGILGPRGTHSEAAAVRLNEILPEKSELIIFPEIFEVLAAVEEGRLDSGFVPVENSLEGSINITLDTLARSDALIVVRELVYPVHNHLMAKAGVAAAVRKIFSHAQPISQCRNYLRQNFPAAEIVTAPSTARAAEIVAAADVNEGCAAICSERAGKLNGLETIAAEIQDNMANSTRFFQVKRRPENFNPENLDGDKALIICQIDGKRAGALCGVLEEFAWRKVNMTRIESRPARTELGAYIFFFDLEVPAMKHLLYDAIEDVGRKSIWLKNLGIFPVVNNLLDKNSV